MDFDHLLKKSNPHSVSGIFFLMMISGVGENQLLLVGKYSFQQELRTHYCYSLELFVPW